MLSWRGMITSVSNSVTFLTARRHTAQLRDCVRQRSAQARQKRCPPPQSTVRGSCTGPIQMGQSSLCASAGLSSVVVMLIRTGHRARISSQKSSQFGRASRCLTAVPCASPSSAVRRPGFASIGRCSKPPRLRRRSRRGRRCNGSIRRSWAAGPAGAGMVSHRIDTACWWAASLSKWGRHRARQQGGRR